MHVGDEFSCKNRFSFSPEDLILSSIAMCKVATVRYIARKQMGHWWSWRRIWTKRKTGEAGKLSTHVTAKIKIEGDLTAEQKGIT
jgi:putative redox protein